MSKEVEWSRRLALVAPSMLVVALVLATFGRAQQQDHEPLGIPRAAGTALPTTVVLVRHGEKASDDPNDPTLSDTGKKRAAALAKMLSRAKLEHLYCTEFKRTRMMLEPLAQASHPPITVVPAAKIDTLVHELQALPGGSVAVVVGHSNTLPEIARQLGGQLHDLEQTPNGLMIRDAEYGRFVVLTIPNCPGGTTSTLELQYGD